MAVGNKGRGPHTEIPVLLPQWIEAELCANCDELSLLVGVNAEAADCSRGPAGQSPIHGHRFERAIVLAGRDGRAVC